MYKVVKRDGKITNFKLAKIEGAITKAFKAEGKRIHDDVISTLALKTVAEFDSKIKDDLIEVEDIQDSVEKVLIESGFADVAKAFILYRKQRQTIRESNISYKDIIDKYIDDNRFDNTYSIGGLVFSNSLSVTSNYLVNELFDQEIQNAFNNDYLYLHDLQMVAGHSFCLSAKAIKEKVEPKDCFEYIYKMYGELRALTNEWSGPITIIDFADEISKYSLDEKELSKIIFYFFDMVNGPSGFKNQPLPLQIVLDNTKEVESIISLILKVKLSQKFKWPTFTYLLNEKIPQEHKESLVELINNDLSPLFENKRVGLLEKINYKDIYQKKYAGYGVDDLSGSISLVSLNLARIARESKNRDSLFELIERYLNVALRELEIKKRTSDLLFNEGLYPITSSYIKNFDRSYLTIGITGLITFLKNLSWINTDDFDSNKNFLKEVLQFINNYLAKQQKEKKVLLGLLPLVNEKVIDYLVLKDKELNAQVITDYLNGKETYASINDYQNENYDLFDYLELSKEFDQYFKSNNIVNITLNKKDINIDSIDILISKINLYNLKSFKLKTK